MGKTFKDMGLNSDNSFVKKQKKQKKQNRVGSKPKAEKFQDQDNFLDD